MMIRTYTELVKIPTFKERYEYLRLGDKVGRESFGLERIFNQRFYHSPEWYQIRRDIFIRDNGCDMGLDDHDIFDRPVVHHMNPISFTDLHQHTDNLFNPEYLILVSHRTHNAIHYGSFDLIREPELIERVQNDTCLWKGGKR